MGKRLGRLRGGTDAHGLVHQCASEGLGSLDELTVEGVNVGYEAFRTLAHSLLRSLNRPNLRLLVIGAGAGRRLRRSSTQPAWHLTGGDPYHDTLAVASRKAAEHLGLGSQIT